MTHSAFDPDEGTALPPTLRVLVFGPSKETPYVELEVVKGCDLGPSRGAIIFEGDARLDDVDVGNPLWGVGGEILTMQHIDPTLDDPLVQVLLFDFDEFSCPDGVAPGQWSTSRIASGWWSKPLVEERGPRSSAMGPSIRGGDFLDLDSLEAALPELSPWSISGPNTFYFSLGHTLDPSEQVIGTPPGLVAGRTLHWTGLTIWPRVDWSNAANDAQRGWLFFLLGIFTASGASMTVTALVEFARRR